MDMKNAKEMGIMPAEIIGGVRVPATSRHAAKLSDGGSDSNSSPKNSSSMERHAKKDIARERHEDEDEEGDGQTEEERQEMIRHDKEIHMQNLIYERKMKATSNRDNYKSLNFDTAINSNVQQPRKHN
ncbi:hypothetical protein AYI68_g485 [Smittium mucronatum]|uniref:Uncharacterized protein n=1 Tax=Smittium mucronatum TaxID=133383 RepID=A0A1R0H814_9FUNG|nr:hypothetical protein AYI68_g485 [Smittium mucronatum]